MHHLGCSTLWRALMPECVTSIRAALRLENMELHSPLTGISRVELPSSEITRTSTSDRILSTTQDSNNHQRAWVRGTSSSPSRRLASVTACWPSSTINGYMERVLSRDACRLCACCDSTRLYFVKNCRLQSTFTGKRSLRKFAGLGPSGRP